MVDILCVAELIIYTAVNLLNNKLKPPYEGNIPVLTYRFFFLIDTSPAPVKRKRTKMARTPTEISKQSKVTNIKSRHPSKVIFNLLISYH